MSEKLTSEDVKKIMEMEGKTRGVSIKGDLEYIRCIEGEEGLKKLEEESVRLGYPVKYSEIKEMDLYPVGMEALVFLLIENLFNFTKKDFVQMGEFNSKVSLVVRLFMKYFVSLEVIAKQAPKFWEKYYTKGVLKVAEINREQRYIKIRVEGFEHHPIHCATIEGYMISVMQMVLGKSVTCQETKCVHRGDDFHEFLVRW